jgi:integrase
MARQRRKRGSGKLSYDRKAKQWIARTSDGTRSGRFATYQEAETALNEWNDRQKHGYNLSSARQTVHHYTAMWLNDVAAPRVKASTLEFYKRHLGYAMSYIGKLALEDVHAADIQRALNRLRADGLSAQSVRHVRSVLKNAFSRAVDWKIIRENPIVGVDPPRVEALEERSLTADELVRFFGAIHGDRLEALYHLALTLGMRRGELLGVRWKDINWKEAALTVVQQVVTVNGETKIDSLKTKSSRRVLPLTQSLVDILKAHETNQKEEARIIQQRAADKAKRAGQPTPLIQWNEHGLVFCAVNGNLIMPRNLTRDFKQMLAKAGLPHAIRLHDLRHTALTNFAAVAEAKAVQSIAGHADIDTTMRVYAGRQIDAMRAAVEALEKRYQALG